MKFDTSIPEEKNKAFNYFNKLIQSNSVIEVKKVNINRTIKQNSYLHVCVSLFAIEFGYTLDESKTLLKRKCPFMVYDNKGDLFVKSTSKLDTVELTMFIEWIRNYSSENGFYIPSAEEYKLNRVAIDNEIEINKLYL